MRHLSNPKFDYYFEDNHAIVEKGTLKYIDRTPLVVIPRGVIKIMGIIELKDKRRDSIPKRDGYYGAMQHTFMPFTVILPERTVKIIGEKAFNHACCLKNINFPEGLEEIRCMAFFDCHSLKSIKLPNSIKILGESCFNNIDDLIVNYDGTSEEWGKVQKGSDWAKGGTLVNTIDGQFVI